MGRILSSGDQILERLERALSLTEPAQAKPKQGGRPQRMRPGEFKVVVLYIRHEKRQPVQRFAVLSLLPEGVGDQIREVAAHPWVLHLWKSVACLPNGKWRGDALTKSP